MSELPPTEDLNPRSAGLDLLGTPDLVRVLASEQRRAAEAVLAQGDAIAGAVDAIVERIRGGGSLHYVGAGSSGRLGVLDAAEMTPTFGTPAELVCAHIAGGREAMFRAIEGAEDDETAGEDEMRDHVRAQDAVVGISASGGARFVIGAVRAARSAGALSVALTSSPRSALAAAAELAIALPTGPEAIAGSTRLVAGTAQKIALNAISTSLMVRLGKVYENMMVDLVASNAKLRGRARRLVEMLTGTGDERARDLLARAGGSVKVAVVMHRHGIDAAAARALLERHRGSLRALL
jgi:N-acetylmuramic acid 6-phosphate etherase